MSIVIKLPTHQQLEDVKTLLGTSGGSTPLDLRGLASGRPSATGNLGNTYWSIDTGEIHVSNGTTWLKLSTITYE